MFFYLLMKSLILLSLICLLVASQIVNNNPQSVQIALIQAQQQYSVPNRSIDSIFLKLPNFQQLKEIIESADSLALSKLIQTIKRKEDDIDCEALTIYSDEVIGMIKVAIEKRTISANKLAIIIQAAKAEIERLNRQIERLNFEKDNLGLKEMRQKIQGLIIELEKAYDAFNDVEGKLEPELAKITGFEKEMEILEKNADSEREKIQNNKLSIIECDAQIRKLQKQLRQYRQKRQIALSNIEASQKRIQIYTQKIDEIRAEVEQIQKKIDIINDKADELRKVYIDLEIDVERLRADIAKATAKQDFIILQIEKNQNKIEEEEKKVVEREYQFIITMIKVLARTLPRFEEQNNELYYNCYGEGSIEKVTTGSVVIYIVRGAQLPIFLQKNYGTTKVLSITSSSDINFQLVDIFGPSWESAYGFPFSQSALVGDDFFIRNDFTCLNPSRMKAGRGKITHIVKNRIQIVGFDGEDITLLLGACTRLESKGHLPRSGQQIFYKGIFVSEREVNLYAASCI